MAGIRRFGKPVKNYGGYKDFVSDLYFVFREGAGNRLVNNLPPSFVDVNLLRTDLQHDVDHGKAADVAKKRKKMSGAFQKYAGAITPVTLVPERFPVVQASILAAIERDLRDLLAKV